MSFVFAPCPTISVPIVGLAERFAVHRIYCVGRNYAEHAKEMGFTGREPPFFFMKPADALVVAETGQDTAFRYPSLTNKLHHEVELVVAIGKAGTDIAPEDALQYIYGYAVGLDMTRRDLQNEMKAQGRPWEIGKAYEESAPIAAITPVAQAGDIAAAAIELTVNGEVRQASTIDKLIWSIAETIAHLSKAWTLQPGDLIYTGTPEGVASVSRGDTLTATVTGLSPLIVRVD
ncbi:fumarylacetoacetate (FAA) hydrolase [Novosphingobium sp. Rr 2-17]|uniref:fumarylacetoacetate hydrolase family protein n=1 Tax=Novosphingobium sp. Rr 2-17 TaxID=555793 RepID=UPI000269825F|nr:fumarylacetoacetate hydrolase family protein [Novosphingobium sp. Rr 2-17]EIZ77732.1 fumarylacetoacetate (FAA) hydrolase [Novosphingobium sp. Rr 2-17]